MARAWQRGRCSRRPALHGLAPFVSAPLPPSLARTSGSRSAEEACRFIDPLSSGTVGKAVPRAAPSAASDPALPRPPTAQQRGRESTGT